MDEIEQRLKTLFPNASKSFFLSNEGIFEINSGLRPKKPEPTPRPALVDAASGKEKGDARVSLSYVLHRVRLLDPDNAYGATKTLTDCLCACGLLPGDSESELETKVEQVKVNHRDEQRTTLHIKYP